MIIVSSVAVNYWGYQDIANPMNSGKQDKWELLNKKRTFDIYRYCRLFKK